MLRTVQGHAVDAGHNIAGHDSGPVGGAASENGHDQYPAPFQVQHVNDILRHYLRFDTDPTADHMAVFDDLLHDVQGQVDGYGQAYALGTTAAGNDRSIYPDQVSLRRDQRAAGIAGIDIGIGLDKVFERRDPYPVSSRGADDALGNRLPEIIGIPYGQDDITYSYPARIAVGGNMEVLQVRLEDRKIGIRIHAYDPRE